MSERIRFSVEIDVDSRAEEIVEAWLRRWRRRDVRTRGKVRYPLQGAVKVLEFVGPREAVADLETVLRGSRDARVIRDAPT